MANAVEAGQPLPHVFPPVAVGAVRMTFVSVSPAADPPLVQSHSLRAAGDGVALEPSALGISRELRGAVVGPGVCCQTTMVQVVGTWARDLNLSVPLVPVSGMGTMTVPHPARLVRQMELQRDRFVDTFIVLTGGEPQRYSGSRRLCDAAVDAACGHDNPWEWNLGFATLPASVP